MNPDEIFFRLDDAKFAQLMAMLDAPPERNPGLERLLAVRPPWTADSGDAPKA